MITSVKRILIKSLISVVISEGNFCGLPDHGKVVYKVVYKKLVVITSVKRFLKKSSFSVVINEGNWARNFVDYFGVVRHILQSSLQNI